MSFYMSDAPASVETPSAPVAAPEAISARDAGKILAESRWKRNQPAPQGNESPAEPPKEAVQSEISTEAPEPAEPDVGAAPQEPPAEASDLPTIEAPRSWTGDNKERFASLPRDLQEYVSQREQDRERELRRGQNETAEKLKGLTQREQAAEQARSNYEAALPQLMLALQTQQQGEFADIKTMADVEKLAREDWPRYALWDAQQKKLAAVQQEMRAAHERQTKQATDQWTKFASEEDSKFAERYPEYADSKKAQSLAEAVTKTVEKAGITKEQLLDAYNGKLSFSPRMAAVQEILLKAALYDQAKATAAKPAPKPVPRVMKPGAPSERQDAATIELKALEKKALETTSARDMARLLSARRAAAAQQRR